MEPGAKELIDVTETGNASGRYVRLTVSSTSGGAWASVREVEIYSNIKTDDKVTEDINGAKIERRGPRWIAGAGNIPQRIRISL